MEPEHIRASDADRDRVIERLREAVAEGRLTPEEHEERLDTLYRAKTVGELAAVTRDLPAERGTGPFPTQGMEVSSDEARRMAAQGEGRENIVAVFGGAERKGRWLVEARTNVSVLCGGVELDLREAVLSQREVTIQCAVVLGGLEITVPHGVRVVNNTSGILGGCSLHGTDEVTDPNHPVIRLTGTCMLGGIEVKVKKPKRRKKKDR
ncbi:DUF1707 SHOCT-like domain-containing protein [Streptomonospora nanhaiensis]|uniref:Cell wall-active antibiotics response LiaF-like C-terminal domain-containing protein n=1 Tax=Streptomonospora nanhaiensis TaxID=1323731 RepID=A0A853BQA6_9ACTN|nr:DUF1707 domain-containing protein [Streptomonospora nanhaiensis]MBV2363860.1 DUF1707 domain-containing protein [Streptomonospora nanhaiensis]NYI96836.1 hypothetical protein [Streptomonospora nanhaiensis]